MSRRKMMALVASLTSVLGAGLPAQSPSIAKVEPPNWWANHSINPVRLLVRGEGLGGASVTCPRLACRVAKVNERGTYAFIDVTIARTLKPGSYPLTLRTASGRVTVPFTVDAPLARAGRFQGFGPDDAMYLLMPDRFANGDPSNDETEKSRGLIDRSRGRYYHGGDLAGVIQRLGYLKELGITTIWMNPIYDNNDGLNRKEMYDGQPITDYHGYGATDMYAVDEHLGDLRLLRQLVDSAHALGIKIVLDMVANHTGPYHPWVKDSPTPTWFHGTEAKHPANVWQTWTIANPYGNEELRRTTLDGWFIDILPDFNQDDPDVRKYIIQNTLWWAGVSGIDGIRQDTWPYVPRHFWKDWMAAIKREYPKMTVVGEVLDGDPAMIAFFEGGRVKHDGIDDGVDAMFDFPMHYAIRDAFAKGGNVRNVAQMLMRDHLYKNPRSLVTLLGLHDVSRFMSEQGATPEGLKLAYTFLMTIRGTPLVYYGDELAMPGGNDPDNRRDFPGGWQGDSKNAFSAAGRSATEQSVWSHVQKLLALRAERRDLRRAGMEHLVATEQQFVYRRGRTIVALNNDTRPVEVRIPAESLAPDALGICAAGRRDGAATIVTIPARSGCIF